MPQPQLYVRHLHVFRLHSCTGNTLISSSKKQTDDSKSVFDGINCNNLQIQVIDCYCVLSETNIDLVLTYSEMLFNFPCCQRTKNIQSKRFIDILSSII